MNPFRVIMIAIDPSSFKGRGRGKVELPEQRFPTFYQTCLYWYMCRLDTGRCHRVVNKALPFDFAVFVVVPVVSVHHVLVFA